MPHTLTISKSSKTKAQTKTKVVSIKSNRPSVHDAVLGTAKAIDATIVTIKARKEVNGVMRALKEVQQIRSGKIKPITFDEFLDQL